MNTLGLIGLVGPIGLIRPIRPIEQTTHPQQGGEYSIQTPTTYMGNHEGMPLPTNNYPLILLR